ncbi:MAG TPA: glycosyltransferase [Sedimentibacter sp.]|nr:glycosyltransferase [Sedimentibacter sp.]
MKVVHLSTSVSKSSANTKLHYSLLNNGIDSSILTLEKCSDELKHTYNQKKTFHYKVENKLINGIESKYLKYIYPERESLIYSSAYVGINILNNKLIKEADIIHMHWINGGFISIGILKKILKLNKPIVWTFHDSWPMTGGCHVRYGCNNFEEECGNCRMLASNKKKDFSYRILKRKKSIENLDRIFLIAPSTWMLSNIKKSSLFSKNKCACIPNTLDVNIYKSYDNKTEDKFVVLFGAMDAMSVPYKGFSYLLKSLEILTEAYPDMKNKMELHVFGSNKIGEEISNRYTCKCWGVIKDEIELAQIYSQANVYVLPSLDDNLPGTVMESLACETPVVAFKTGGIPDMVEHKKNGYLAEYKNEKDLADGIAWVYENNNMSKDMGKRGRYKVVCEYSNLVIAKKHIEVYKRILNINKKKEDKNESHIKANKFHIR